MARTPNGIRTRVSALKGRSGGSAELLENAKEQFTAYLYWPLFAMIDPPCALDRARIAHGDGSAWAGRPAPVRVLPARGLENAYGDAIRRATLGGWRR